MHMSAARPRVVEFSKTITVETPEHVALEFELAGLGARTAAIVVDLLILSALWLGLSAAFALAARLGETWGSWAAAVFIAAAFVVAWGYFALFEALWGGRTPGKRRAGIRVVMDTGHPITFTAAAARNLVRIVDVQPLGASLVGVLFVFFHPHHKRLGDIVAGTVVIRDRSEELSPVPRLDVSDRETMETTAHTPLMPQEEFGLLEQFLSRLDELDRTARIRLAADLGRRFAKYAHESDPHGEAFLSSLYQSELGKRRARVAGRRLAPGEITTGTAERFVALKQASWEAFRQRAESLERRGLRELSGGALTEFAAQYREVAADLARCRTYGVDSRVVNYLARVVSAGHNALYGLRGVRRLPLRELFLADFPAAVWQARAYIMAAALLFFVPGVVGYAVMREQPELAQEVIPDRMIARAEEGRTRQAEGRGYAETPSPYLPVVASSIVANNVQVAFAAFAFGITAGIGTVVILVFNGLFFGSVLGLFANYSLAGWILTFVAGHGVLELTAIFVAGGAGLLLGRHLLAPGDLARRDALVVHGRTAIRLVGAATFLLLLAGLIEGFLSASDAPAELKFAVSGASLALVALYLAAGRRAARGIADFSPSTRGSLPESIPTGAR